MHVCAAEEEEEEEGSSELCGLVLENTKRSGDEQNAPHGIS